MGDGQDANGAQTNGQTATGQGATSTQQSVQQPANSGHTAAPEFTAEQQAAIQAEVSRILGKARDEERQKAATKYADYDDLKAAKKRLDEIEAAQLSEQEKLAKRLKELEDAKVAAERLAAEKETQANLTMLRAAITAEAGKQRARFPEDAWALVNQAALVLGEDGKVEGAEAAVKALIDGGRLPTLDKPNAPEMDGGRGAGHKPEPGDNLTDEQVEIAKRLGIKPEDFKKYRNL